MVLILFRAVVNLPEALGTHFSLKTAVLREFVSVAVSSGFIILWKCRKVTIYLLGTVVKRDIHVHECRSC